MKHKAHRHLPHHTHHHVRQGFDIRRANWLIIVITLLVIAAIFYIFIIPAAHAPSKLTSVIALDSTSWQKYVDPSGFSIKYPKNFIHNQLTGKVDKKNIIHEFTDKNGNAIRVSVNEGLSYAHGATVGEILIGSYKATTYFSAHMLTITNFGISKYEHFSVQIESPNPQFFEAAVSTLDLSQVH